MFIWSKPLPVLISTMSQYDEESYKILMKQNPAIFDYIGSLSATPMVVFSWPMITPEQMSVLDSIVNKFNIPIMYYSSTIVSDGFRRDDSTGEILYHVEYGIPIRYAKVIEAEFKINHSSDLWFYIGQDKNFDGSLSTKWLQTTLEWKKKYNVQHSDTYLTERVRTAHSNGLIIKVNFTVLKYSQ